MARPQRARGKRIKTLRGDLEKVLGPPRELGHGALARAVRCAAGGSKNGAAARPTTSGLWLHLVGYCLRPGFGYPLDPFPRRSSLALRPESLAVHARPSGLVAVVVLWRRSLADSNEARQVALLDELSFYLAPPRAPTARAAQRSQGARLEDMVRLVGRARAPACGAQGRARRLAAGALGQRRDLRPEWVVGVGNDSAHVPPCTAAHTRWCRAQWPLPGSSARSRTISRPSNRPHSRSHSSPVSPKDRQRDLEPALRERAIGALKPGSRRGALDQADT